MEILEYIIFGVCMLGIGISSYHIGLKEGIGIGAGMMWDRLWSMGKPRKRDPQIRSIELHKDSI